MRAVVIYARFSSDRQNERSIDDQVRVCREFVERHGAQIIDVYADFAMSGASLIGRPRANQLLDDAESGRFDTVVAEALDRLSRDQEDVARIHKLLTFHGVQLVTLSEGPINALHVGLKGTMNALLLTEIANKVRRGQKGRAAEGSAPGGLTYGYEVVITGERDRRGQPIRGGRRIHEEQAAVVRRIFEQYAAGLSPRTIATGLNRDGIPSPRKGSRWSASTINGNAARATGMLHNSLYRGELVYGRVTMVKDPRTGKRVQRVNPPSEWVIKAVPELRVVSDELWNRVHVIKGQYGHLRVDRRRRPRHAFSGLVVCGSCGAAYTVKNNDQLACAAHRESGTCDNGRTIRVGDLQERVLKGIKERLLSPEAIAVFLKEYHEERRRLRSESRRRRGDIESRMGKVSRQIDNLVDAIAEGIATAGMKAKLLELEREKGALLAELDTIAAASAGVVELHPAAVEAYRARIYDLQQGLAATDAQARQDAVNTLRSLVERIEVHPGNGRGETNVYVHGVIAELVNLPHRKVGEVASAVMMVAAEGFEPPTKGL